MNGPDLLLVSFPDLPSVQRSTRPWRALLHTDARLEAEEMMRPARGWVRMLGPDPLST